MSKVVIFACLIGAVLADRVLYDKVENIVVISPTPIDYIENEIKEKDHSYRGNEKYHNEEYYDDSNEGKLVETIPGKSGADYPSYTDIPKTGFSCRGRQTSGYYADTEAGCQVFHICVANNHKISFLCPNGSIFNQKVLVCDWWFNVDCASSYDALDYGNEILKQQIEHQEYAYENYENYDLNLASSGGNKHPKSEEKIETTSKNEHDESKSKVQSGKNDQQRRSRNE